MALVEGGDICIIPPRRNQAAAKIDAKAFELLGKKDISVKDVHKADHVNFVFCRLENFPRKKTSFPKTWLSLFVQHFCLFF
jgi:hypothetical protein